MKNNYCVAGLLIVMLCPGCVAWHGTSSPGATGVVLDAKTHAPVDQAAVAVSELHDDSISFLSVIERLRGPVEHTDKDGKFSISREFEAGFGIGTFHRPSSGTNGTLVVVHNGYEPAVIPFSSEMVTNFGEILLNPVAK